MLKKLMVSILLLLLSACTTMTEREKFLQEETLIDKAERFATFFNGGNYHYPPVIVARAKGVKEVVFLNHIQGMIGHETYEETPFQQFLRILREDNDIGYVDAVRKMSGERQNYFAEDCPNIKQALSKIKHMDLTYHHNIPYNRNPGNVSYSYLYIDKDNGNVAHRINTGIAEHPVSEIYRIAKKAIKECPYPTDPPKL